MCPNLAAEAGGLMRFVRKAAGAEPLRRMAHSLRNAATIGHTGEGMANRMNCALIVLLGASGADASVQRERAEDRHQLRTGQMTCDA